MSQSRLARLRSKLAEKEIDGILISNPENRHYLSGFDGSAGYRHREGYQDGGYSSLVTQAGNHPGSNGKGEPQAKHLTQSIGSHPPHP